MLQFNADFYKRLFSALDNNSVLMRVDADGTYYPVWCSDEFCQMMEGTQDDFIRLENASAMNTIHPDDHEAVRFLFKNHHAPDGSNSLTIRKTTVKNHQLHVCVHYAFIEEGGVQYAYCSYFDVTDLKESQLQTEARYGELNAELEAFANDSLAVLRFNLTRGVLEQARGRDLFDCDKAGASYESVFKARLDSISLAGDREKFSRASDIDSLRQSFYDGATPEPLVLFSRRKSGKECFVRYSTTMRKDPQTGDIIVLAVESEHNYEKVTEVLENKVLATQYDMVCYISGDSYGVVIGDAA